MEGSDQKVLARAVGRNFRSISDILLETAVTKRRPSLPEEPLRYREDNLPLKVYPPSVSSFDSRLGIIARRGDPKKKFCHLKKSSTTPFGHAFRPRFSATRSGHVFQPRLPATSSDVPFGSRTLCLSAEPVAPLILGAVQR